MGEISTNVRKDKTRPVKYSNKRQYNYLKYWRVVSYWARKRYDISSSELDMLLYLYDMPYFKREDFNYYGNTMSWDKKRFITMKRKGLVKLWREGGTKESRSYLYELTVLGKTICRNVYKKLEGEPISDNVKYNPVAKKETFSDKMYSKVIEAMNAKRSSDND